MGENTYEVEIVYDSAEKQIYSLLYRNNHLVSSQYVYIVSSEKDFGLNYQLQQILKREKENLIHTNESIINLTKIDICIEVI